MKFSFLAHSTKKHPYFSLFYRIGTIYRHAKTVFGEIRDRIQAFFFAVLSAKFVGEQKKVDICGEILQDNCF